MKLNIAYPTNGTQICMDMSTKEEQRLYGKKIGEQFDGKIVSEDLDGSILQIAGGNDMQGVCMVPGKDTPKRIRLLLSKGDIGYRCRRKGVRRRKTVRGSIVSNETQVLNLLLVKENKPIQNLTTVVKDKTHLPKKISKLCETFNLEKGCNIRQELKKLLEGEKMPNLRIVRKISAKELKKREEKKKLREKKKAAYAKDKAEYETKYGVKI